MYPTSAINRRAQVPKTTGAGTAGEPLALPNPQVQELEDELKVTRMGTLHALTMMLDIKDVKTGRHATRVAEWAVRVAERMGLDDEELRDLEIASILHDIGKVGIPDAILLKPGRLTDSEMRLVKRHPEFGWAMLRSIPGFERVSLQVLHHHERFDGGGYPSGLAGEAIPLGARIVAVVDTFDAMMSNRPYRRGLGVSEILDRLEPEQDAQFDGEILRLFLDIAGEHVGEVGQIRGPSL